MPVVDVRWLDSDSSDCFVIRCHYCYAIEYFGIQALHFYATDNFLWHRKAPFLSLSERDMNLCRYESENLKICSVTVFKRPSKFNAVDHCSIIEMHFSSWFNRFLFDLKRWKKAWKYLKTPKSVKCFKNVRKRIWNVPKTIENIKKLPEITFSARSIKFYSGKSDQTQLRPV